MSASIQANVNQSLSWRLESISRSEGTRLTVLATSPATEAQRQASGSFVHLAEVVVVDFVVVLIFAVVGGAFEVVEGAAGVVDGTFGVVDGAAGVVDGALGVVDSCLFRLLPSTVTV